MFWVYSNGRRYLYEARREGGRVKKKYLGTGPMAEALMIRAQEIQTTQSAASKARAAEDDAPTEAERLTDEFVTEIDQLVRAALLGAGFHQHDRGSWRRKRRGQKSTAEPAGE